MNGNENGLSCFNCERLLFMKNDESSMQKIPPQIREHLVPDYSGDVVYECIACGETYAIDQFLYTCPGCKSLLRLSDRNFAFLKSLSMGKFVPNKT